MPYVPEDPCFMRAAVDSAGRTSELALWLQGMMVGRKEYVIGALLVLLDDLFLICRYGNCNGNDFFRPEGTSDINIASLICEMFSLNLGNTLN